MSETASVTDSQDIKAPPTSSPYVEPTLGQDIRAGLLGIGIAVLCLVPPLIHFVSGPLGPAIGGFFAAARIRARGKHVFYIGLSIGIGVAISAWGIAAILSAFGLVQLVRFNGGHPSMDPSSVVLVSAIDVVVFLYSTALGCVGAYLGGRGDS